MELSDNKQMRKELEQKLFGRWPAWFNPKGDSSHTLMSRGFLHTDGWFDILWRLCEDLETLKILLNAPAKAAMSCRYPSFSK